MTFSNFLEGPNLNKLNIYIPASLRSITIIQQDQRVELELHQVRTSGAIVI